MNEIFRILTDLLTYGLEKFGLYYSIYRGYVVDRKDPENLGRLLLQIPQITGVKTHTTWAYPVGMASSYVSGRFDLPEEGEMVWVQFELGNPKRPLWQFGYRGSEDHREKEFDGVYNVKWFRTKEGHKIVIHPEYLEIFHKSGVSIKLDSEGIASGKGGSYESAALGESLKKWLEDLSDFLAQGTHVGLAVGSIGPLLSPDKIIELNVLKAELSKILAQNNKLN